VDRTVLITGASGFLGGHLLSALLQRFANDRFLVLARSDDAAAKVRAGLERLFDSGRARVVTGDVTEGGLGLSPADLADVRRAAAIWHVAASTSFDDSLKDETYRANVVGTGNILGLAGACKRLETLYFVSTAYVAGTSPGPIAEDELPPGDGFRNPYESTKWQAEKDVRESGLPWTIFRPSIIMGHSKTLDAYGERRMMYGYLLGIYFAVRRHCRRQGIDYRKLLAEGGTVDIKLRLLGSHSTTKNFVCIDPVLEAMLEAARRPHVGRTFNVVSPTCICGLDIARAIGEALRIGNVAAMPPNPTQLSAVEQDIMGYTGWFAPYTLNSDPNWQTDNVQALLPAYESMASMTPALFARMLRAFVDREIIGDRSTTSAVQATLANAPR